MSNARTKMSPETDRIVRIIDETRVAEHFRNSDRPNGRAFPKRSRQPIEITRAKTRLRTQAWRNRMDERRAPTTAQFGAALVSALACSARDLNPQDWNIVMLALTDLRDRGFDVQEAKTLLRNVRARNAEHVGHDVGSTGAGPSGH